jgi:hypothetical protein
MNYAPEKYARVATFAIPEQPGINPGLLRRVEDDFTMKIITKGYSVVSRSDVDRVMREIGFQTSGLTDPTQKAAQMGKILNVPGIVLISVNHVQERQHVIPASSGSYRDKKGRFRSYESGPAVTTISSAAVSARLIDVSTTDVLWMGQASSGGGENPLSVLQSSFGEGMGGAEHLAHILASKVASTYPPRFQSARK